jgi:pyridoxine 5'-phosphate synthase PdxJ
MASTDEMVAIALRTQPHQCTLVPERPEEVTTEGGLEIGEGPARARLLAACERLRAGGIEVSLFIDPDPKRIAALQAFGGLVSGFELNTDAYTKATGGFAGSRRADLARCASVGVALGFKAYAGHGLTAENVGAVASMDALQQRICDEVKPGVDFVVLHAFTHRQLANVLREHQLVTCTADEAVSTGITRGFLPHGLGHLLGLQVHDAGGRQADTTGKKREPPAQDPFLRLTRTLQPGVVVTIEPGLYFIPSLLRPLLTKHEARLNRAAIERLVPFGGIRIEDNVEVTADGHRNLTRDAFTAASKH